MPVIRCPLHRQTARRRVLRVLHGLHAAAHRIGDVGIRARVVRDNLLQNAFADEQRVHRQGDLLARFQPAVAPDHNRVTVLGYRRRQLQRAALSLVASAFTAMA